MKTTQTSKHVSLLLAVVLLFSALVLFPQPASAATYGNIGFHCTVKNYQSGRLIIGDSRCCQLWNAKKNGSSFVSVWGGHYGYGGSSLQINTDSQQNMMKSIVQNTIKQVGHCDVYVFATVNDYNGSGSYTSAANHVINQAKTAMKWTAKYGGKTVKPQVYVVSLVGGKGKNVSSYNTYLKLQAAKVNCKFLSITKCLTGSNSGYRSDGLHYNDATLKNIWSKIL